MMTLDPKEILLVQKLRNRVTDVAPKEDLENDYWLIRWLRAREMDLDKAEVMLRKSMAWNHRNEIDSILDWKPIHNYFRYAVAGSDNDGSPVFIIPLGLWDMREIVESGDIVPGFRGVLRILSRMEEEIKISAKSIGKPVSQLTIIFDFQQFSYRQLNHRTVVQGSIEFFRIFESNHPEILKHCYFVNTPRIFPVFFSILKPFMTARTYNKMEFFGPQKSKWSRAILKTVPAEILPPYYGGVRTGSDEYCSTSEIWNDGSLPPNYFATDMSRGRNSIIDMTYNGGNNIRSNQNRKFSAFEESDLKEEEIPAGSKLELEFSVPKSKFEDLNPPTILLKWRIKSDGYDIGFQVSFKDDFTSKLETLIDNHRIESHLSQIDGSIVCDRPGIYLVTFDNTYSKRRKKVIHYSVSVEDL